MRKPDCCLQNPSDLILAFVREGHSGIGKDADKYCRTYLYCQLVSQGCNQEPIESTELPSGPWQDISMDFLAPLPSGHWILSVLDYYSR